MELIKPLAFDHSNDRHNNNAVATNTRDQVYVQQDSTKDNAISSSSASSWLTSAQQARTIYEDIITAGPPSPPIGFPAPRINRTHLKWVLYYDEDKHNLACGKALIKVLYSKQQEINTPYCASNVYLLSECVIKKTLCGEIVFGTVLQPYSDEDSKRLKMQHQNIVNQIAVNTGNITSKTIYKLTEQSVGIKIDERNKMETLHSSQNAFSENPWKEVSAMQLFQSAQYPNIVKLLDALVDDNCLYEIMPYYNGGTLYEHMNHHPHGLSELEARHYFREILKALVQLMATGLCHRDISTQNFMLTDDGHCILIDLGMSLRTPYSFPDDHNTEDVTDVSVMGMPRRLIHSHSHCGKLRFMSPEMYCQKDFDGFAVDLWGAGIILFVLLTGRHPYHIPDQSSDAGFYDLMHPTYYWGTKEKGADKTSSDPLLLYAWGRHVSDEAIDLLRRMLQYNPKDRLTLADVIEHPWVVE